MTALVTDDWIRPTAAQSGELDPLSAAARTYTRAHVHAHTMGRALTHDRDERTHARFYVYAHFLQAVSFARSRCLRPVFLPPRPVFPALLSRPLANPRTRETKKVSFPISSSTLGKREGPTPSARTDGDVEAKTS
jgi:hypothetical protein